MNELMPPAARSGWVQVERTHLETWMRFTTLRGAGAATRVMFALLARMGPHNAIAVSQKTLGKLLGMDDRSVRRAVAMLREHNWLEVRAFGERGGVNVYIINDRIAWSGPREGIRYSKFSATILLSSEDQPDRDQLDSQPSLMPVIEMFPGEMQLPAGDGLPPPSEPALPGLEPDAPSIELADPDEVRALTAKFAGGLRIDPETGEF